MSISTEQILDWKQQIDEASTQKTVLETQLKERMKDLEEFGVKSIADAEKLLDKYQTDLHDKQDEFDKAIADIRDNYDLD